MPLVTVKVFERRLDAESEARIIKAMTDALLGRARGRGAARPHLGARRGLRPASLGPRRQALGRGLSRRPTIPRIGDTLPQDAEHADSRREREMTNRIVIVGGGLAAARVAKAFRKAGGKGAVTMLSADTRSALQPPAALEGLPARRDRGRRRVRRAGGGLRRARRRPAARERGHAASTPRARTVTLADGERAAVRQARARLGVAPALARHAGRGARGRPSLPHAHRRHRRARRRRVGRAAHS